MSARKVIGTLILLGIGIFIFQRFKRNPSPTMPAYGHKGLSSTELVSVTTTLLLHSERDGHWDTSIESRQTQEIARLKLETIKTTDAAQAEELRPLEWIVLDRTHLGQEAAEDANVPAPTTMNGSIPLDHPSLRPVVIELDARGALMRYVGGGFRTLSAARLMMPMFPRTGRIKAARWIEPVSWQTQNGEWKITWAGELLWRMESSTHFVFEGLIRPQLAAGPAWCPSGLPLKAQHSFIHGQADFDPEKGQILGNTVEWQSVVRANLNDLSRIPMEARVGHNVQGRGELVWEFKGKSMARDQP